MMWRFAIGILLGLAAVQAAPAQRPLRPLDVPSTAAWKHAASGLILPPTIDGFPRVSIGDSGTEELDVSAQYEGADGLIATIYLFRPQVASVPLWFDRARTVLEQLRLSQNEPAAPGSSVTFALPGGTAASGMRVTYPFTSAGYRSTGVAIASAGGWLVKVRMSSKKLEPLQLDAKLASFVGAIRWPAAAKPAIAAEPITSCPDKLAVRNAKVQKPDMAQAMLGSLVALAGSMKGPDPATRYCREANEGILYSVYRPVGTRDNYLMAIADSGRVLSVGAMALDPKEKPSYSVTLLDLGQSAIYPSFDRLPEPRQVLQLIQSQRPVSSNKVGSTTININGDAKR